MYTYGCFSLLKLQLLIINMSSVLNNEISVYTCNSCKPKLRLQIGCCVLAVGKASPTTSEIFCAANQKTGALFGAVSCIKNKETVNHVKLTPILDSKNKKSADGDNCNMRPLIICVCS